MSKRMILLLILAFVALTFGSFIWYVATWSPGPAFALDQILPPEASAA